MQIPAELRRRPPDRTLAWVEKNVGPGARVARVQRLRNAWAAAMHAIDVERDGVQHAFVLRRWARADIPPDVGVVANEVAALTVLEGASGLAVPRLVAADAAGTAADVPAVLMTRVPGRDDLAPVDLAAYAARLAGVLRAIHATPVAEGVLNYYRPWSLDMVTAAPDWSGRPAVWERAIEIANQPVPAHTRVLVHRDFHPGNVLWQRGQVSGVVDWTHTCRGPAAVDVAHCRMNLAVLFGMPVADAFAREYGDVGELAWHDITDTVSLGNESPAVWRWHDAGRTDVTVDGVIDALDAFLADAVSRFDA